MQQNLNIPLLTPNFRAAAAAATTTTFSCGHLRCVAIMKFWAGLGAQVENVASRFNYKNFIHLWIKVFEYGVY